LWPSLLNLFPLNDIKLFFSFLSLQYELKSLKQPLFSSTPRAKLFAQNLNKVRWNVFTEEQKNACSKINNFFCGLHLLVNFAECASPALKGFDALCKDQGESDVIGELENEFQADERDEIVVWLSVGNCLLHVHFSGNRAHDSYDNILFLP
jgi:hypothetical protein